MDYHSWTCLTVVDGPAVLSDEIRKALIMAACELSLRQWNRQPVVSETCEGVIETSWESYSVGARTGVLFRAQVESDLGPYRVNFLLSSKDLEYGAEILRRLEEDSAQIVSEVHQGPLPPELTRFYDLSKPGRRT